jgi:hypothetical protein
MAIMERPAVSKLDLLKKGRFVAFFCCYKDVYFLKHGYGIPTARILVGSNTCMRICSLNKLQSPTPNWQGGGYAELP